MLKTIPSGFGERISSWGILLAVGLVVADASSPPRSPPLLLACFLLLLVSARRAPKPLPALAAALLLAEATVRLQLHLEATGWTQRAEGRIAAHLASLEERKRGLIAILESSADRVAALPEIPAALGGDRAALVRLFRSLESLRATIPEQPALAVHSPAPSPVAWSGRISDPAVFQGLVGPHRDVFILEGSVSTTLVATAPILRGDGQLEGFVVAALPVAVRRNIRNEFLRDFDLFAGTDPGVEIHYVDARSEAEGPAPFPPLDPALQGREALLRSPDGGSLAAVRVASPGPSEVRKDLEALYRFLLSLLASSVVLVWAVKSTTAAARPWIRWLVASAALRAILLYLGPPLSGSGSSLLSPDVYASTLLGPLLRSPLDLFLTVLWFVFLAGLLLLRALSLAPSHPSPWRMGLASLAAVAILGGIFTLVADTVANSSLDLESIPLIPRSPSHLVIQASLLLVLAAGVMTMTAVFGLAGPLFSSPRKRLLSFAGWTLLGLLAYRFWPRHLLGIPLLPAVALFLLAALLGGSASRWRAWLQTASLGGRAGLAVLAVSLLAALLYPSLVHFGEKNLRLQIEQDHTPLVLRQPQWRAYVLAETQRRIDALKVLEETPQGPHPPGVEELAFAVWAATDLAARGVSSAVEIQDASGAVISRFALDLPSLSSRPLPSNETWKVSQEQVTLASAERRVLHARKLLAYHGEVHGAIHLWVADDYWNLPFLRGRDPYSVLYRTASPGAARDRPLVLLAYGSGHELLFSSASRPPAFDSRASSRLGPGGFWTTLDVAGARHHTYLFAAPKVIYGLAYPQLTPGRYAADLVEAVAGLSLVSLLALFLALLVRTVLRRPTLSFRSLIGAVSKRFALRLLVAFIAVAVVPVVVLQLVVRGFMADRFRKEFEEQALERATFAKKIVEDYAFYQRGQASGSKPVSDDHLVWMASVIRNDLDVFEAGRLLASSKRELYDSGLLAPRVSGAVYRSLILEGQPSALRTERIGDFSYLVVSVPVRLDASEPGILSIPLASRQREVEATVDDLDRTIRLASVVFLVLAAVLAHSMARRISGPISDLTEATRRIAQGDLETRVIATSRDELMRLVESFNQMAQDLDRQRRDLERSNRLAAWAEMARQVAHEVKNPLTPIQLSAEHLLRVYRNGDADFAATLEACTQTILKQIRILRGIVTEFSAFARPPEAVLGSHDPAVLVAEVLKPYRAALPPAVQLSLEVGAEVPRVAADRRLLERAVVNLVENALQAVGDAGRIWVRLRAGDGGRRVEVEVQDSGRGVEPEIRERIFEPFFSTKTSGSGLGLALVKKIAEDHGGGVTLESPPGEGTRAVLWLPVSSQGQDG